MIIYLNEVLLNYGLIPKCTSTTKKVFTFIYILRNEIMLWYSFCKEADWLESCYEKVVALDCSYFRQDLLRL